jgi:hypothetical protein
MSSRLFKINQVGAKIGDPSSEAKFHKGRWAMQLEIQIRVIAILLIIELDTGVCVLGADADILPWIPFKPERGVVDVPVEFTAVFIKTRNTCASYH